jgi:hypothetical protein
MQNVLSYLNKLNVAQGGAGLFGGGFFQSLIGGFLGISGFASGTSNAPGGMAVVGERGPEVVHLPRGSKVAPNHDLRRYMPASNNNAAPVVTNDNRVVNIDARGAVEGTADQIRKAIAQAAPGIVSQSVAAVGKRARTNPGYL